MFFTLLFTTLLSALLGWLLDQVIRALPPRPDSLVERIDALLPQIQCAQCGYPGCRPYAEAIADNRVDIDQCPPGGEDTLRALARLLDSDTRTRHTGPTQTKPLGVAVIDETRCIGCTLCIQACPVDAILGASRFMHTVIASECTGCELCVSPCPVDCISMSDAGGLSLGTAEVKH
ncbi:MAG: electron transport complex subunit RsxB [Methylococcaceae bacterium]